MEANRILVIEDDPDTSEVLRYYFTRKGHDVRVALTGQAGLDACTERPPDLILLDVRLPDINGMDVCQSLRSGPRTAHIPVIFVSEVSDQNSRLRALELGADDYVTKPFDIDELGLRVKNTIVRMQMESLTDPRTGLPATKLIKEQIRKLMRAKGWACLVVRINEFGTFSEMYPYPAGDLVIRATGRLIGDAVNDLGAPDDFVGQAGEVWVIITKEEHGLALRDGLLARFAQEVGMHYDFGDRQRGYLLVPDGKGGERQAPLMSLTIKFVTDKDDPADIRDIV